MEERPNINKQLLEWFVSSCCTISGLLPAGKVLTIVVDGKYNKPGPPPVHILQYFGVEVTNE